ncbi:hypothetical protein AB0B50_39865 [Streptomyces sp. NPDC041068]|uniref:hypothetical protein n=1 Tax=Streptomyces sp. NPDC041068 TaxID=3155130 RepID=UPI0033E87656
MVDLNPLHYINRSPPASTRTASGTPSATTPSADGKVRIWVDTWGESFFACDELRWLAYVAGADDVSGPHLAKVERWHTAVREDDRS